MRNHHILSALALFLFSVNPAIGQTAAEMMSYCQPIVNAHINEGTMTMQAQADYRYETGKCWGAFRSIQALSWYTQENTGGKKVGILGFCPPGESMLVQFVRIFDKFAKARPDLQHENYESVALTALQSAFPCK
jgi:hypothetical protein